jgi:hypothetical protein
VVRARVSPWRIVGAAVIGWSSLGRWAKAIRARTLFAQVRPAAAETSLRDVAQRAAVALAGHASSSADGLPLATRAFLGAAHVT